MPMSEASTACTRFGFEARSGLAKLRIGLHIEQLAFYLAICRA